VLLKQIFDSTWLHLERIGRVHANDESVRKWVSARVIACAKDRDLLDVEGIKTSVLKSLHQ
jgi:hypothetical protein